MKHSIEAITLVTLLSVPMSTSTLALSSTHRSLVNTAERGTQSTVDVTALGQTQNQKALLAKVCSPITQASLANPYVFRYGLTGQELQDEFFDNKKGYNSKGYRPVRLTGYTSGSAVRFATKWVKSNGPEWKGWFGMTGTEFHQRFQELKNNFILIDVSGYNTPQGVRYAAIWERNTDNVNWAVHRDVSRSGMQNLVNTYTTQNFAPVRVEAYLLNGQSHYISVWAKGQCGWKMHNKMTRQEYQNFLDQYKSQFRLVHLDSHTENGQVYYSGIWWQQPGPAQVVRSDRDWYLFQRFFNNYRCDGYVLDNFYGADVPGGLRYGGIWTFNTPLKPGPSASLESRVSKHVDCAPGRGGAAIVNLTKGEEIVQHADQTFGTSSTIKSAILYALLRKVDAGNLNWSNTQLNVGSVYGNNQGNTLTANKSYSLAYLAQTMIADSNNWATNRLINYIGMAKINQEIDQLGLKKTQLSRYMTGTGAPSAHGKSGPGGDYAAGFDNVSTPREMTTLLKRIHQNQGNLLSQKSYKDFWDTLNLQSTTKGYINNLLSQGVGGNWQSLVTIFNKAGSNSWGWNDDNPTAKPGDYTHKPQIGSHLQRSEAGRLSFQNGQTVFYAVLVDEADGPPSSSAAIENRMACVGVEVVREYAKQTTGKELPECK